MFREVWYSVPRGVRVCRRGIGKTELWLYLREKDAPPSDFTAAGFALAASMSNKAPTALPKAPDRALELSLRNGSPAAFVDPYQDVKTKIIAGEILLQENIRTLFPG